MEYEIDDEEPTIQMLCRKYGYEKAINDRTYCTRPEKECIYRAKSRDDYGYRCMMLDKQI